MEQLIAAVRCYPCLWNTTAIEYRDQELKDAAWAEVMKETNLSSVKDVKLKWKKLRDSYRDALKRASEMQAREAPARKNYPWKYMSAMGFLQPHMSARKRPAGAPPPDADPDNGHDAPDAPDADAHNGHDAPTTRAPTAPATTPPTLAPRPSARARSSQSSTGSLTTFASRRQAQGKRRVSEGAWRRGRSPPAPAPDPLDIFFNSMCQSTKRFPYPAQLKVKRALFEAVMAGEEALLAEQQSYASLWARAASASSSDDAGAAAS
ncbi:uncharacterized protein isoform X1 [Choristoneura fumiferana]|uniref:uncharacterized protein isoform X1 n=1 Tax=Choristoneura fumiferana TaxID=7141 RepID=UPI003D154EC7